MIAIIKAKNIVKNMGLEPPIDPVEVANNLGLSVVQIDMSSSKDYYDVAGYIDLESNKIIINKDQTSARKSFTVAHEIGHFLLHKTKIENDGEYHTLYRKDLYQSIHSMQREASRFAEHLLVPDDALIIHKNFPNPVLASLFQVSQQLISIRKKVGW